MARIPYPDLEKAHPRVREVYAALPVKINIFRMLAHAERNFEPVLRLGGTILARQQLAANLRELAILRVSRLSKAEYEWVQHVPIAEQTGCSREQVAALEKDDASAACFNDVERAVLGFTDEVVKNVRPSDTALAAVEKHLSHQEIMELTLAIGFYMLMARVMEVSGIEIDKPEGARIVSGIERALDRSRES